MWGAGGATLAFQVFAATAFTNAAWWLPVAVGLFVAGIVLLAGSTAGAMAWQARYAAVAGFLCVSAALFVTPGIWSALTMLNSSSNQTLPAAYSGQNSGPSQGGGLQVDQTLLNFLTTNTQGEKYLMAVPSSMQGADYVIATGRPVLYLGGFNGQDKVESADSLAQLVKAGQLRYIYMGGQDQGGPGGPGGGMQADISNWVTSNCTAVQGYATNSVSAGAPDGIQGGLTNGANGGIPGGFGRQMQLTLYDCQGAS